MSRTRVSEFIENIYIQAEKLIFCFFWLFASSYYFFNQQSVIAIYFKMYVAGGDAPFLDPGKAHIQHIQHTVTSAFWSSHP